MKYEYMEASLSLFKGIDAENANTNSMLEQSASRIKLLQHGILASSELLKNVQNLNSFTEIAIKLYGIDLVQLNSSFYKNFSEVDSRSDLELTIDQLLHYSSTYGGRSDIANHGHIYEPEALDEKKLVGIKDSIKNFTELTLLTKVEIEAKLKSLLTSGMALSQEDISRLLEIINQHPVDYYEEIANKELMVTLFDEFNYIPKNFDEFMRYVEYKITGSTLLIKNHMFTPKGMKYLLNGDRAYYIDVLFIKYVNQYGVDSASENARRYYSQIKYLHSISKDKKAKRVYNRILRRSKTHYIPRKSSPLEHVIDYQLEELKPYLNKANSYKLVKIYNYLSELLGVSSENKMYFIRNGSSFLKDVSDQQPKHKLNRFKLYFIRSYIKSLLSLRVSDNLKKLGYSGLTIHEGIEITVPTSGKDFIGSLPFESKLVIPKKDGLVAGIGWDEEADLDLHARSIDGSSYGWNTYYRDDEGNVTYSGDMTALNEHGHAAEFYRISSKQKDPIIIDVSEYYGEGINYSIFINGGTHKDPLKDFGITGKVSNHSAFIKDSFTKNQCSKMLFVIVPDEDNFNVYFIGKNFLNAKVPNTTDAPVKALEFLKQKSDLALTWSDLELEVENDEDVLVLDPKSLTKDILTDLLN